MNLKHALLQMLSWRKQYFLFFFLLIAVCSVYYLLSPIKHPLADVASLILSFLGCCIGLRQDNFSWKYFQALPLSKRELFHLFILNQFIVLFPFLVWNLTFFAFVMDIVGVPYKGMNPGLFLLTLLIYISGSLFLGMVSFFHNFENIRAPYAKTSGLIPALQKIRNLMYYFIAASIGVVALAGLSLLVYGILPGLTDFLRGVFGLWTFIFSSLAFYYWWVFRRWNREELSYTKINFKVIRDVPIMLTIAVGISTLFGLKSDAPAFYGNSGLLETIYQKDFESFARILKESKSAINQKSVTGMTPLMAAAHTGNLNLFHALEKAGAERKGIVTYPKSKIFHGMNILMLAIESKNIEIVKRILETENPNSTNGKFSALNFAAYKCSPEMVDLLLEKGAEINAVNNMGLSSLHIASRNNCLPVIVSLIEAGADPILQDKSGKLAKDYIKSHNDRNRIGYYLEKKMRSPAGK